MRESEVAQYQQNYDIIINTSQAVAEIIYMSLGENFLKINEFNINGVKLTIIKKPQFEMVGFKRAVNFGDGSIGMFINQLTENGKIKKLTETLQFPQQIWVCLSDCQSCGLGCSDFQVCCRVCIEKTESHDLSNFDNEEIVTFPLAASEWVLYETNDKQSTENLHNIGVYEFVKQIGYRWNENIRLHFDNEHECYDNGEWINGKIYRFFLPVVSA